VQEDRSAATIPSYQKTHAYVLAGSSKSDHLLISGLGFSYRGWEDPLESRLLAAYDNSKKPKVSLDLEARRLSRLIPRPQSVICTTLIAQRQEYYTLMRLFTSI
jgi:hypothetical protein